MMNDDIRLRIFSDRKKRIAEEGFSLGVYVPDERILPCVDALASITDTRLICEVKRSSPSKGIIDGRLDPVKQAGVYHAAGVRVVSVLTEEDYFSGSLQDLIEVKRAYPDLAVLRKDFLYCEEDIDISFRAGADLVLLIASLLSAAELGHLYRYTLEKGMTPLVEVHSTDDIDKVRPFRPLLTGINCRNLKTFTIDRLFPVGQKQQIDWETSIVYESGIWGYEDAFLAGNQGFSALLIGESVVRDPKRIPKIRDGLTDGIAAMGAKSRFWERIAFLKGRKKPIVKICGITNREDAEEAVRCGADILGFIFADSPRETDPGFVRSLAGLEVLKVAVIVDADTDNRRLRDVNDLLDARFIDAVQFHGDEPADACFDLSYPYYKAFRLKDEESIMGMRAYHCPRVLIDAYHPALHGGTGKQIDAAIVEEVSKGYDLWIAGGVTQENVAELVRTFSPELIDISSGVESYPGKKDGQRLKLLFDTIEGLYENQ